MPTTTIETICPVCGGTEFESTIPRTVAEMSGEPHLFICKTCSAVFTDMTKATEAAKRISKERIQAINEAISYSRQPYGYYPRPGDK